MDTNKSIHLPPPKRKGEISLEEAIARRRSIRDFTPEPISTSQLSQILWAAQGITDAPRRHRATPSAGATYPLEIFVVLGRNSIVEVGAGIYHYNVDKHTLSQHYEGDIRLELAAVALHEESIHEAPLDIVICAEYERTLNRYGSRGTKYVHMEVGHAAQNIYLQATALGLGTVVIGAFNDEQVSQVLRLKRRIKPLYIMPIGKPT